ncbi:putative anthranilate phosphoribosyltransferase [Talaromyces proteolyticus]|uniref:Anthranilate phosphoribosyltransferase n=1 Tax=Talaromyces proteolyticus TaxID=1131652 RepID=A0AAD4Q0D8_9EURO|nr:putative anthranilate phosphoribosyltransferase [Talaromyces proteolyticus]KAH8697547.1 putative anthranilate phosphoribosyltransferase [Talaromyces proteolyticus]
MAEADQPEPVSISPLLKRLAYPSAAEIQVSAEEIAAAFALIFENRLSTIQTAALLTLLHSTGLDRDPKVIALCSERMREAASTVERAPLRAVVKARGKAEGNYRGGLCDIVGTGGDGHSTFNVSTTSSIIAAALLMVAKHGNRSQTSFSGSADVLNCVSPVPPNLSAIKTSDIAKVCDKTNYLFLFAPNFHKGMKYAEPVRRGLGIRTIFNLMGPLANPIDWALEARLVGVAYQSLGPVFIEALRLGGAKKALVVCGEEDMDEISCAGPTNCWRLSEYPNPNYKDNNKAEEEEDDDDDNEDDEEYEERTHTKLDIFQIHPSDFGFPTHPIEDVYTKKMPKENAGKLMSILRNELDPDDPLMHFILINTAALLVTAGVCEAETSNMGPGDDGKVITERGPGGGRWKEGVRRARWAIESGQALKSFEKFIEVTNTL